MKYAFLCCLMPFLAFAQQQQHSNKLADRLSVEINAGVVSDKTNTFGFVGCDRCSIKSLNYLPLVAPYYAATLAYDLGEKHRVGIGGVFTKHGHTYILQFALNDYVVIRKIFSKFIAIKLQHEYDLLTSHKIRLGVVNSFDVEHREEVDKNYLLHNKETIKDFSLSYMLRLSFGWQLLPKVHLTFGPAMRINLTEHYKYSYSNAFHRFGYGALFGLKYEL